MHALPRAAGSPALPTPALPPRLRAPHVLVVDDDLAMRTLLADVLVDAGYDVTALQDGEEALRWQDFDPDADRFVFTVDLVVTDLRMSRLDGLELLAAIRASGRALPVVMVSGFADDELRHHAGQLGATAVLAKPFSIPELVALVERLCPLPGRG
ncbi:MAG: response regulator [Alphaproteobacteria bacterium]|nr:response regulator [Alphaproteobacteria bacterium]